MRDVDTTARRLLDLTTEYQQAVADRSDAMELGLLGAGETWTTRDPDEIAREYGDTLRVLLVS